MSISVVQAVQINGTSGNFNSAVTALNTIILVVVQYTGSGDTMTTSSPQYNGSTPAGSSLLIASQSPSGEGQNDLVYCGIWCLPHVPGGGTAVQATFSDTGLGILALEVAGLGSSPQLDPGGGTSTGSGLQTVGSSTGLTPAITQSPELVVGAALGYAVDQNGVGSPWTEYTPGNSFVTCGYQIVASSGNQYRYNPTANSSGNWASCIATICAKPAAKSSLLMALLP